MSALVAIIAMFCVSALGLIALLAYLLRERVLRNPTPPRAKPSRWRWAASSRREDDLTAEQASPLPLKTSRSRLISATSLAEAEAADAPLGAASAEPAIPGPALGSSSTPRDPIIAAAQQAVVFRQHFPPHLAINERSYFGGSPCVPGTLEWPRDPASGSPLHFICQIDLAEVPAAARLGLLPDTGVLAVFLDLQWGPGEAFRVVWQQGYAGTPWRDIEPPRELALAYGDEAALAWPWALTPAHGVQLLARWPFKPVEITLPEARVWQASEPVLEALMAAQAQGAPEQPLAQPLSRHDFLGNYGKSFIPPWPGFPHDWLAVQTTSAALVREADRALLAPRADLYPDLDDAARAAQIKAVRAEAQAWFDHALGNPALGPVAPPVRKAFWDWFASHRPLTEPIAPTAVEAAIEATLHASPHEAAKFPPQVVAWLAHRHVLAQRSAGSITARTPVRMLAPPSPAGGEAPELAATHLLLLELASNPALGHRFGDALTQFWITPEDLADRRFDQVVLTRAAG